MRIAAKEWFIWVLIAIFGICLWYKFGYPQFAFVDLSLDKNEALKIAESYLKSIGVNPKGYLKAIVFIADDWSDRYLQKTIGLKKEEEFLKHHDYELFFWKIRFFKELQKEEYVIRVSPKSGDILSFGHLIEDAEFRKSIDKATAKQKAVEFLKKTYGFNLEEHVVNDDLTRYYDKRIDYIFSWKRKDIYIPWGKDEGGAKLLIGVTVSGDEIRGYYKNALDIPEKFQRYISNQLSSGEYFSSFSFLSLILFLFCSIFIVVKKQHTLMVRVCKKWFLYLGVFCAIINFIYFFNNLQDIMMGYPTSSHLASFIGLSLIKITVSILFFSVIFILPGLAGEWLRSEVLPGAKFSSFSYYIRSTFYSRGITYSILFGYILFIVILGAQAVLFYFGQQYLGVWKEWSKLTHFSSAYLPFLSAFTIGSIASLSEEIIFRLFGVSLIKKYLKNTILAVIFSSLTWGIGHAGYAIFPFWFRGLEVTLIGFFLGFVFLKYGLIPLIVAHYLFDVFWGISAFILTPSPTYLFIGSLLVLVLPMAFAAIAYFMNQKEQEKEFRLLLNPLQKYNLSILIPFISMKKSQGIPASEIKKELIAHNWDSVLVDLATSEVFINQ